MSASIQLQAVVEAPYFEGELFCPWEISNAQPFSMIRLSGEMEYLEIGLVMAQLAKCNQIKLVNDKQAVINKIIDAKSLILPGGIQAIGIGKKIISPSCCCGLEAWREWIDCLSTGRSPWLGHDPSPWIQMEGDRFRIWSDEKTARKVFHIELSRAEFKEALKRVEQDLQAFLLCLKRWAQELKIPDSYRLIRKFDECFSVRKPSQMR